jgi:mycothiol system anti-sigma-R factor
MKEVCRETLQKVYLYMDGEILSVEERRTIRIHLEECAPCYERYGVDEQVKALVARISVGCRCPEELRSKLTRMIDEAG